MQNILNHLRYHPKSRLILSLSLMLTVFLLFVIHSSAADDFEYVCIVDAGSTGSRIHVYKYRQPEAGQELISVDVQAEEYKKVWFLHNDRISMHFIVCGLFAVLSGIIVV